MQADAEAHGAPLPGSLGPHLFDLLGDGGRRLTPGQNHIDLLGGQILRGFRRAAEVQRWTRLLQRWVEQLGAFHADVLAVVVDGLAFQYPPPDAGELHRGLVTLFVVEEQAVAGQFVRIATGHQVEQRAATGEPVEGRRLARRHGRGNDSGTQGHEEFQPLGHRDQRGGHQPRVLAGTPGGYQHTAETKTVGGLGHLLQITVVDGAGAFGGAKVMAVAVGRQEPENVEAHGVVS